MKIFYINIDSRDDKKKFMESQFEKLDIKAERISAVTPANTDITRIRKKFNSNLSDKEIACSLSHIKIWKKIIKSKKSYALILEDDVILSENLHNILNSLDKKIHELHLKKIDLLRLETRLEKIYQSKPLLRITQDYSIVSSFSNQIGAAAYIVSLEFCKKFIAYKNIYAKPIDLFLFYNDSLVRKLNNNYQLKPALATNHKSYSIIFRFDKSHKYLSSDLQNSRIKNKKIVLPKKNGNKILREIKAIQFQLINLPKRIINAMIGRRSFLKQLVNFK